MGHHVEVCGLQWGGAHYFRFTRQFVCPAHTGENGALEECHIVSIDTFNGARDIVMCGVVYTPMHKGGNYRDVPSDQICFDHHAVPMSSTVHTPKGSQCVK